MVKKNKSSALGRGLESLLSISVDETNAQEHLISLDINSITPGKYQPRIQIDDNSLEELVESIKTQGVIQPIIVREKALSSYEIIAGERRWRASQIAKLKEIPAIIRNISDENALAIGLIENMQRMDLNPIEEAEGLKRLLDEFHITHDKLAKLIGKSRSSITNTLRLLNLPEQVKDLIYNKKISMGHVRPLLTLSNDLQIEIAQKASRLGWSVREVERKSRRSVGKEKIIEKNFCENKILEKKLRELFRVRVKINANDMGKTKLVFNFNSHKELDSFANHIIHQQEKIKSR